MSACSAAALDRSKPHTLIELLPSKVEGKSVATACPAISTARSQRSCSSTNRSEAMIAQPAPSEVGEHCSLVKGAKISLASLISCSVYSVWNWA